MVVKMDDSSGKDQAGTVRTGAMPDWKAFVLALSAMQIGPNLALAGGYQYPTSGEASWLVFGAAGLLGVLLTIVIGRFAAVDGQPLALLNHVQDVLPRWVSSLTASALLTAYLIGPATGVLGTTIYVDSIAQAAGLPAGHEALMAAAIAAVIGLGAIRGLSWTATLSMILGTVCLPLALWMTVRASTAPAHPLLSTLPHSLSDFSLLASGAYVAMGFIIGFDCIVALASTTANPRRTAPRAMKVGVIGAAAVLCIGVRLQSGALRPHLDALAEGLSPSSILLAADGNGRWSVAMDTILVATAMAGLVAWLSGAAIVVSRAAGSGLLPSFLSAGTGDDPRRAVIGLTVVSIALPAAFLLATHASALSATVYLSNFMVLLWLVPYALACLALLVGRSTRHEPTHVCVAALAALVLIVVFTFAQFAAQADAVALVVYAAGAVAVGGLAMLMSRAQRRGAALRLESP
jgi:amino acid transporter